VGNRKTNPGTIPGKTRDGSVRAPALRKFSEQEIEKNNDRWRKMQFARGNPDWETTIHPCHRVGKPDVLPSQKKKGKE